MRLTTTLCIIIIILLTLILINSQASALQRMSGVELGTSTTFEFTQYGTYLFYNSTVYAQSAQEYPDHINFINATLGSQVNIPLSFGLGSEFANITLTSINSTSVGVNAGSAVAGEASSMLFFYFTSSSGAPLSVYLKAESSTKVITSSEFYTNSSSFTKANAPATYLNESVLFLTLKLDSSSSVLFSFLPYHPSSTISSSTISPSTISPSTISPSTISSSTVSSSTVSTSSSKSSSQTSSDTWLIVGVVVAVGAAGGTILYLRNRSEEEE